jgi:hypothetical protein
MSSVWPDDHVNEVAKNKADEQYGRERQSKQEEDSDWSTEERHRHAVKQPVQP